MGRHFFYVLKSYLSFLLFILFFINFTYAQSFLSQKENFFEGAVLFNLFGTNTKDSTKDIENDENNAFSSLKRRNPSFKSQTEFPNKNSDMHQEFINNRNFDDWIWYDITIVDNETGEQIFFAEGDDCHKTIIEKLNTDLSPFW